MLRRLVPVASHASVCVYFIYVNARVNIYPYFVIRACVTSNIIKLIIKQKYIYYYVYIFMYYVVL